MIGKHNDTEFKIENYEEFYSNHRFVETRDEDAINVHELIPRFGWAFDMVAEYGPRNLLDLGTLDGSFPITIAHHFGIPAVGIDLTFAGIDLARKRAEELKLPVHFYRGLVEKELRRLDDHSFDMITMFEFIEHVKNPQLLIKEIDRVLAPGGSVLLSTPDFESPLYGKDDEQNKCHIRLYTTAEEDYEAKNKFGNVRKATSIIKEIGKERIKDIGVYSHLINVRYQ